jgi:hypothetical protein
MVADLSPSGTEVAAGRSAGGNRAKRAIDYGDLGDALETSRARA